MDLDASVDSSSTQTGPFGSLDRALSDTYNSVGYFSISKTIPKPYPPNLKLWKSRWHALDNNLSVTSAGGSAWGQATSESLWKIWHVIDQNYEITESDIIFDWGCGLGKMLFSSCFLLGVKCVCVGVEKELNIYSVCKRISRVMNIVEGCYSCVEHGNSALLENFCPATVVVQYDGPNKSATSEAHRHIMKLAFTSSSVQVILSTKLSPQLYSDYFSGTSFVQLWRCVGINGLMFGKSTTKGYLWLKRRGGGKVQDEYGVGGLQHLVDRARSQGLSERY